MKEVVEIVEILCITVVVLAFMYGFYKVLTD